MRLIDADALLDKIHDVDGMEVFENSNIFAMHYERMVKSMPTIEELKTGKWIRVDSNTFKCSACGNFLNFHGVNAGRGDANYCPNCGAKMEVDE